MKTHPALERTARIVPVTDPLPGPELGELVLLQHAVREHSVALEKIAYELKRTSDLLAGFTLHLTREKHE